MNNRAPAAQRRVDRLIANPEYGPKLARLSRSDERRVLDLVAENRGLDARKLVNELDTVRRAERRRADKRRAVVREYIARSAPGRREAWQDYNETLLHEHLGLGEAWRQYDREMGL